MKHDVGINALRGLAALTVLAAHGDTADLIKSAFLTDHKVFLGHFGVALFFVLSGALIWRSAQRSSLGAYTLNRTTRILPLYLVNLAACVLLLPIVGTSLALDTSGEAVFRHLTFTQSFDPNVSRSLNPVLWTLSFEAAFYALVPLLCAASRYVRPEWWLVLACGLVWLKLPVVAPFVKFLPLFCVGIVLEEARAWRVGKLTAFAVGAGFGLAAFVVEREWLAPMACAVMLASVYLISLPSVVRIALAPVAWIGVISYSLYIWHWLMLDVAGQNLDLIREVVGPVFRDDLWRAIIVLASIFAVSAASYWLVERPFMGPIRRLVISRQKLTPALQYGDGQHIKTTLTTRLFTGPQIAAGMPRSVMLRFSQSTMTRDRHQ